MQILFWIVAFGCTASFAYYALCLVALWRFEHRALPQAGFALPVTLLKPLHGADPGLYEALRSHCVQEYDEFQILFGVAQADDPAVAIVERLIREFPQRDFRLSICPETLGHNRKVSTLVQLLPQARHEFVLVNDADLHVPPDYLRRVMAWFAEPRTGMVTCLYRGVKTETMWSGFEALGINTDFMPGVLVARVMEGGMSFALGGTLAMRRAALDAIGGFTPLLDYLADDYELGHRMAQAGWRVELADVVVETRIPAYDFDGFVQHQLRWLRTIRDARPAGFAGLILTFAELWAILALALAAGGAPVFPLWVALAAVGLRWVMAQAMLRHLLRETTDRYALLLLGVRDFVRVVLWTVAWMGHTIVWRGERFRLHRGKLAPTRDGRS